MKFVVVLLLAACVSSASVPTPSTEQPKAISNDLDPSEIRNDQSTAAFAVAALIDLAIGLAYFLLFCILRPRFDWLYNPRNLSACKVEGAAPALPRGLFSWLSPVLRLSEEELLRTTGLDAVMYVRFFKLGCKIFSLATILGIVMLIVNVTAANQVQGIGILSLANIAPFDSRLWTHLVSAYILSFGVYWLLRRDYLKYLQYRLPFLRGEGVGANALVSRSVVVYNVPHQYRSQEGLLQYFRTVYGDRVENVALTCKVSRVEKAIKKRDKSLGKLEHAVFMADAGKPEEPRKFCCGSKRDSVDDYTKELGELNRRVTTEQSRAMEAKKYPVAFVTFTTEQAAHIAVHCTMSAVHSFELEHAPEPRDVLWRNCKHGERMRVLRYMLAKAMVLALILFWTIPVAFVASLTTMANLTKLLPFLSPVLSMSPTLQGFIQGFLPTLALALFLILLPRILTAIAVFEGIVATSWVEMRVFKAFTLFSILDIFLATTLAGSLLSVLQQGIESPLALVNLLGQSLPGFSTFFAVYILLKTAGLPQGMCNLFGLALGLFRKRKAKTPREIQSAEDPGPLRYGVEYSSHLLVLIIGLSYTIIAPIVPFCALLFFIVGYAVEKHQVAYVYIAVYETGGAFWPLLHNRILAGLVIAQLTSLALFGLKQAPAEAALMVPLLGFTLLYYCLAEKKYRPRCYSLPADEARSEPQEAPRAVSVYHPSPLLEGGFVSDPYFPKRATAFNPEDVSPLLEAEPDRAPGTKPVKEIAINVDGLTPTNICTPRSDLPRG